MSHRKVRYCIGQTYYAIVGSGVWICSSMLCFTLWARRYIHIKLSYLMCNNLKKHLICLYDQLFGPWYWTIKWLFHIKGILISSFICWLVFVQINSSNCLMKKYYVLVWFVSSSVMPLGIAMSHGDSIASLLCKILICHER